MIPPLGEGHPKLPRCFVSYAERRKPKTSVLRSTEHGQKRAARQLVGIAHFIAALGETQPDGRTLPACLEVEHQHLRIALRRRPQVEGEGLVVLVKLLESFVRGVEYLALDFSIAFDRVGERSPVPPPGAQRIELCRSRDARVTFGAKENALARGVRDDRIATMENACEGPGGRREPDHEQHPEAPASERLV